jgi:phage terminase small subunit
MNPAAGYLTSLEGAILKIESELGITPAARSRLKVEAASVEDTLDRLFRRARKEEESE